MRTQIMSLFNGRAKYPLLALASLFIIYLIGAASPGGRNVFNSINRFSQDSKSTSVAADVNEDVAFCVATKDHPEDLLEFFIHHYHHHGIRRFYVMDDGSSTPLSTFNDYGIPREHVSFHYFDDAAKVSSMQTHIYSECIRLYGSKHKWMAFIDSDEFIETIKPGETLLTILKELDPISTIGALGINWRLHSSAGIIKKVSSVRKHFTSCCADPPGFDIPPTWKDSRLIKSIVKTDMYDSPLSPHQFKLKKNAHTVGEYRDVIDDGIGVRVPITKDRIALHHYTLKSREQFEDKLKTWKDKDWSYWDHIEGLPQVECLEMTKYNP